MRVVIVGGGLAGCVLASRLGPLFDVTVTYNETTPSIYGVDYTHALHPSVAGGLGGTSRHWHNVLIRIDDRSLRGSHGWVSALDPYMSLASDLYGLDLRESEEAVRLGALQGDAARFVESGLRVGCPQFVPKARRNAAGFLPADVIKRPMAVSSYDYSGDMVRSVRSTAGRLEGDVFVDATGGLGAISTLGRLQNELTGEKHGGSWSYEDHLCGFVGSLTLNRVGELAGLFGKFSRSNSWSWRVPVIHRAEAGFDVALYFYPRFSLRGKTASSSRYLLSNLRNGIDVPRNVMTLLRSPSDLYNLASFYLGDPRGCRSYEVFAVLQHPECLGSAIVDEPGKIWLRANIPDTLCGDLQVAFGKIVSALGNAVDDSEFYDDLSLDTGAHYSATFPIGDTVSPDYRALGFRNLFACGGAVLPETGYSNTGLTITAQAIALADVIMDQYA